MNNQLFKPAYTPAGQNANNAPDINVLGMVTKVKITHTQTYGQFSCIETHLAPRQMGPPPHVHYELDEIMRVTEGTVTILAGDEVIEIAAGGYHFRPRGIIHTFFGTDMMHLQLLLICIPAVKILPITWKSYPSLAPTYKTKAPTLLRQKILPASKHWMPATTMKFFMNKCQRTWQNMGLSNYKQ